MIRINLQTAVFISQLKNRYRIEYHICTIKEHKEEKRDNLKQILQALSLNLHLIQTINKTTVLKNLLNHL